MAAARASGGNWGLVQKRALWFAEFRKWKTGKELLEEQKVANWKKIRRKSAKQRVKLVIVAWNQRETGGQQGWTLACKGGRGIRDWGAQAPDPPGFQVALEMRYFSSASGLDSPNAEWFLVLYWERYTTTHCIICQRRCIGQNLLLFPRREALCQVDAVNEKLVCNRWWGVCVCGGGQ